ncbi:hypothetical protein LCGC14_1171720 [marine sediment metagenome]|uniref:Uncharacterized protein n=1 Tax=marine sediment metagenome TaxID=412755 RepID=A0A0F9MCL5_9ZZZZ
MVVTNARIMDNAVDESKIKDSAVQRIQLAPGEKFEIIDNIGFVILRAENDNRKVSIRGKIDKVRP